MGKKTVLSVYYIMQWVLTFKEYALLMQIGIKIHLHLKVQYWALVNN